MRTAVILWKTRRPKEILRRNHYKEFMDWSLGKGIGVFQNFSDFKMLRLESLNCYDDIDDSLL